MASEIIHLLRSRPMNPNYQWLRVLCECYFGGVHVPVLRVICIRLYYVCSFTINETRVFGMQTDFCWAYEIVNQEA